MNNPFKKRYWETPPASILSDAPATQSESEYNGEQIAQLLTEWGAACSHVQTTCGAAVVQCHFNLLDPSRVRRVAQLIPSLEAVLHTKIMQAPSSVAHFSLTINRANRAAVPFKSCILTKSFNDLHSPIGAVLGTDTANRALCIDLAKMPHLLIAGATGSGKSVCLNTVIASILYKSTPVSAQFVLIDPKQVELTAYEGLPHLAMPIVTGPYKAVEALRDVCTVMDSRYAALKKLGLKNIEGTKYPRVVVVIDELADLMLTSKSAVETYIVRVAQLGRAAGIHLIVATQRPTVNVITGLIKANMPARIALQTASMRDSMNILDYKGAETLTGRGDALLKLPDQVTPIRFQTAYTSENDLSAIVRYWKHDALTTA